MSKMATMVVAAAALAMATGCEIAATNGNNCGNINEGQGGSGGGDGTGGGGLTIKPPDGGVPLKATVPIKCSEGTHTAPVTPSGGLASFPLSLPLGSTLRWAETTVTSSEPPGDWLAVIGVAIKVQTVALAADVPNASAEAHKIAVVLAPAAGGLPIEPGKIYFGLIGGPAITTSGDWTCYVQLGGCVGKETGEPCGLSGVCNDGECVEDPPPG